MPCRQKTDNALYFNGKYNVPKIRDMWKKCGTEVRSVE